MLLISEIPMRLYFTVDYYEKPQEVSSWRSGGRRAGAHSGISNTSCFSQPLGRGRRRPRSNFIYPMRAPSDIDRDSPPPPYVMFPTPPPAYSPPTPGNALTTREMVSIYICIYTHVQHSGDITPCCL